MSNYIFDEKHLLSESDVEQKVIYPLLTNDDPIGLGYHSTEIQTKVNLKKLQIDKGTKSYTYYPDYLITIGGLPSIVVEAKRPHESMEEAFRQAALYAAEINRFFGDDVNPCKYIIACDGLVLCAGVWDNAKPAFIINVENWSLGNDDFTTFISQFSAQNIKKKSEFLRTQIRKKVAFKKPLHLVGGKNIQNRQIKNSFGETISIQYRHLFNPNIEEEKIDIVKNAYVKTTKHQSHVTPIDRLIRKKVLPSSENSIHIKSTENPKELISKLQDANRYNNQVLLLIGSVGSGKSTFTTYLKEVALNKQLLAKLVWITLDLNNAPVSNEEIYKWLKENLISEIKKLNSSVDFDDYDVVANIFKEEITKFDKIAGRLLDKNSETYRTELFKKIIELQSDIDLYLKELISKYVHEEGKELIIILDNCDKRNLEQQLLMFEVASWIKETIKALVFLPLRDTTYDNFKAEKPLDTVIKDLIFRITPAPLEKVIYSRIKYASRLSEKSTQKFYYLQNNIKVSYPASDELYYLKSILSSLFQNYFFKRLITGLTGSNIRNGIEIFLDFCKSGHISDNEIFKIRNTRGDYLIPNHVISKVFFRDDRLYFNDESSRIKNLFHSDPNDKIPNPFVRIEILKWLHDRYRSRGVSGILGFHKIEELISDLISLGYEKERVHQEILNLIRQQLIVSETQDSNNFKSSELFSINISGIIHLELLINIDYLSACSEDTWYNSAEIATEIAKNMAGTGSFSHLSIQNAVLHSELLVKYLTDYHKKFFLGYSNYISENLYREPLEIEKINAAINNSKNRINFSVNTKFSVGEKVNARVNNILKFGIFVNLDNSNKTGFISNRYLSDRDFEIQYHPDDFIIVEILNYNSQHKRYEVKIAEIDVIE